MAGRSHDALAAALELREQRFCVSVCDALDLPAHLWSGVPGLRETIEILVIVRAAREIESQTGASWRRSLRAACARYGCDFEAMRARIRRWKKAGAECTQNNNGASSAR